MEDKLKLLFDYQRFEGNTELSKVIAKTERHRVGFHLSDDDLDMVSAAGDIDAEKLMGDESGSDRKNKH